MCNGKDDQGEDKGAPCLDDEGEAMGDEVLPRKDELMEIKYSGAGQPEGL